MFEMLTMHLKSYVSMVLVGVILFSLYSKVSVAFVIRRKWQIVKMLG